ncbi:MAG: hypothetical protein HY319_31640 [Armatimonadetes bacterium]|nr:hypothetical protein [Armatimonadota bacterium]
MDVVLTSNSPGELSSWVRVTVESLKRQEPDLRVVVALVPCPYASGAEMRVASRLKGVDVVLSPCQTVKLALGLPVPEYRPAARGVVGFLGGEPWHALLLAFRLRYPAVAYMVRPSCLARNFRTVAVCDRAVEGRLRAIVGAERVRFIGNLMVDGVATASPGDGDFGLEPGRPVIGLFPGSRHMHLRATLGAYLALVERIALQRPEIQFLLALSPFVRVEDMDRALIRPLPLGLPTCKARYEPGILVTDGGCRLAVAHGQPYEVMRRIDVALSIPGTNTAELACAGKPMVITLHPLAHVGGGGLSGLLEFLPLGKVLKSRLRRRKYSRLRFTAHPNIIAQRHVVPEIVIGKDLEEVQRTLLELIDRPEQRLRLGQELRGLMGPAGAADKMARTLLDACA